MKTISATELKKKINSKSKFIIVDVLPKESFELQHIPTAINIPLGEIGGRAQKELPNKKQEIIVYCSSSTCGASPTAGKMLESMGYKNVAHFKGGLAGWQEKGYKFEK
ncbi:rhodanese-like domain-containing protein [Candidatus Pacearchaeota archaeon]|nr:rhodanese-like domain-containing protein [Candidatus Pacearchaeota archaeon]